MADEMKFLLQQLRQVRAGLSSEKAMELREMGNALMKKASLENDKTLAHIAVLSYALHKLLTKEHVSTSGFWIEYKMRLLDSMDAAITALEAGKEKEFDKALNSMGANLQKLDEKIGRYIQGFYDKGRVKYAADAYYYGLSLSQAAALTGVGADELQSYIGFTRQHDIMKDKKGIRVRLDDFKQVVGIGA